MLERLQPGLSWPLVEQPIRPHRPRKIRMRLSTTGASPAPSMPIPETSEGYLVKTLCLPYNSVIVCT